MFEGTVVWKAKFDASMRKDIKIVNKKSVWAQVELQSEWLHN